MSAPGPSYSKPGAAREPGSGNPNVIPSIHNAARDEAAAKAREEVDSDGELMDALEDELEDEQGARWRERRMEELRRDQAIAAVMRAPTSNHGRYTEPVSEKDLVRQLGEAKAVVVHFYKADFRRCQIVDKHLEFLAPLHHETLFLRISVLAAPFLVEKLGVQTLPCIVLFGPGGKVKDQIVGFQDLGNKDSFASGVLEWRLGQAGILNPRAKQGSNQSIMGFAGGSSAGAAADDELDWD